MPAETALETTDTTPDTPETTPADPKRRFLCRHIFADGHRCGSPALRGEPFCYYHHASRRPAPPPGKFRHIDAHEPFDLPIIEDRASALLVTSHILSRIASNDLDCDRAARLIAGLRVVVALLPPEPSTHRSARPSQSASPSEPSPELVEDAILDETHGAIAPIAEAPAPVPAPAKLTPPQRDSTSEPRLMSDPQREHTPAEENFLDVTISTSGYEPGNWTRPETLSDEDIILRVNAERRCVGLPQLIPVPDPSGALLAFHAHPGERRAHPIPSEPNAWSIPHTTPLPTHQACAPL